MKVYPLPTGNTRVILDQQNAQITMFMPAHTRTLEHLYFNIITRIEAYEVPAMAMMQNILQFERRNPERTDTDTSYFHMYLISGDVPPISSLAQTVPRNDVLGNVPHVRPGYFCNLRHGHGTVCWGVGNPRPWDLRQAWTQFWESTFNAHWMAPPERPDEPNIVPFLKWYYDTYERTKNEYVDPRTRLRKKLRMLNIEPVEDWAFRIREMDQVAARYHAALVSGLQKLVLSLQIACERYEHRNVTPPTPLLDRRNAVNAHWNAIRSRARPTGRTRSRDLEMVCNTINDFLISRHSQGLTIRAAADNATRNLIVSTHRNLKKFVRWWCEDPGRRAWLRRQYKAFRNAALKRRIDELSDDPAYAAWKATLTNLNQFMVDQWVKQRRWIPYVESLLPEITVGVWTPGSLVEALDGCERVFCVMANESGGLDKLLHDTLIDLNRSWYMMPAWRNDHMEWMALFVHPKTSEETWFVQRHGAWWRMDPETGETVNDGVPDAQEVA